jgi:hypothetical protein
MKTRARIPPCYTEQPGTFKAGDDAAVSGSHVGRLLPPEADPVSESQDQAPRPISAFPFLTSRSKINCGIVARANPSP